MLLKGDLRPLQRCKALHGHPGEAVGSVHFPAWLHSHRSSCGLRSSVRTSAAAHWRGISTDDSGVGLQSPSNMDHTHGGCFPALSAGDRDGGLVPGLPSSVLLTHATRKCEGIRELYRFMTEFPSFLNAVA